MLPHGKCVTIFGGNLSKGCLIKITTKMSKNSANDNYIKNKKKKMQTTMHCQSNIYHRFK